MTKESLENVDVIVERNRTPEEITADRNNRRLEVENKVRVNDKPIVAANQGLATIIFVAAIGLIIYPIIEVIRFLINLAGSMALYENGPSFPWIPVLLGVVALFLFGMIRFQRPNTASVFTFFGNYVGTYSKAGIYFVPIPFLARYERSLAQNNFESEKLKINDENGNPLAVSTVVVYRVANPAQTTFSVNDFKSYLAVQAEGALRHVVSHYPYDTRKVDQKTLLGNLDEVNDELLQEISSAVQVAGLEIVEARINNLSYSVEIAQSMLQRQQAEAVLAARELLVEGSATIVQDTIKKLGDENSMTSEQRATLITNLLTVLVGERSAQPVVKL